jgi:M6 family metalloprotease-like protein
MKKSAVIALLAGSLFLAGCDHNPYSSQNTASTAGSSSSSVETSVADVVTLNVADSGSYCQGMVYKSVNHLVVTLTTKKADGSSKDTVLDKNAYRIASIVDPKGNSCLTTDPFSSAGNYTITVSYGDLRAFAVIVVTEPTNAYDVLNSLSISDASASQYAVGDSLTKSSTFTVTANWQYKGQRTMTFDATGTNGYQFVTSGSSRCLGPDGETFDPSKAFNQAGTYTIAVQVTDSAKTTISSPLSFTVRSGVEAGYAPKALSLHDNNSTYATGDSYLSKNKLFFHVTWDVASAIEEDLAYSSSDSHFALTLVKKGTTANVLTSPLEKTDYVLTGTLTLQGKSVSATLAFTVGDALKQVSSVPFSYQDFQSGMGQSVKATGNQKVLVIPTYFKDETYSTTALAGYHSTIEKGFFGTNEECGWRSFTGYYEAASHGTLHYSGTVASSWYQSTSTVNEVNASANLSSTIASQALAWFKTTFPSVDLSAYDSDNDNYIDSLYIIYAHDAGDWGSGLWGFRSSTTVQAGSSGKQASAFSWFSMSFLNDTSSYGGVPDGGINTRIIIHEHGHMLGLPDYYDYTYSGVDYLGCYDMQDGNYLDWNSVSKFLVGWVKPYYVDSQALAIGESVSVSLNPAANSGDCLVLRNTSSWNGSAFDEYLMLDLFNGSLGNNTYDAQNLSNSGRWSSASLYGVRMLHADARLYGYNVNGNNYSAISSTKISTLDTYAYFDGMVDNNYKTSTSDGVYHNYYFSSLASYAGATVPSEYNDFHFLEMLQRGGSATFKTTSSSDRKYWNGSDLWETGNSFALTSQTGYTAYGNSFFARKTMLNDGTAFPFAISCDSVTATKATLTIKRVA